MVYCLDAWGFHESLVAHGFKVLEKFGGGGSEVGDKLLPEVEEGEAELAMVIVEAVAAIFRGVAMCKKMDDEKYRTVLLLVKEVRDWFRSVWD